MSKKPIPNPYLCAGTFNGRKMAWLEMFGPVQTDSPAVEVAVRIQLSVAQSRLPINKLKQIHAERVRKALAD